MANEPYSNLEVVPNPHIQEPAGLEFDQDRYDQHNQKEAVSTAFVPENESPLERKRICGISAKAFWIVAIIVGIIIIAGAVGGGVGGSLASKSSSNPNSQDASAATTSAATPDQSSSSSYSSSTARSSSSSSSTSVSPSTTTGPPISTTTIIGPTYTLVRTCPSANNTLYSITYSPDITSTFLCACGLAVVSPGSQTDTFVVDEHTPSLEFCINAYANQNVQRAATIASGQEAVCNAVRWANGLSPNVDNGRCLGVTYSTGNGSVSDGSAASFVELAPFDSAVWVDQRPL